MRNENVSSTEYRLADLERRMNAVIEHLSLDFPPLGGGKGPSAEVVALAAQGDMATAMRVVQELG